MGVTMKNLLLYLLLFLFACANINTQERKLRYFEEYHRRIPENNLQEYYQDRLKELFLCECIERGLELDSSDIINSMGSSKLLWELLLDQYHEAKQIKKIAMEFADTIPVSNKFNQRTTIIHCLDYYNSIELDSLIKKLIMDQDSTEINQN